MADYTTSEILNEVSRVFRARLDPGREGGTLNTQIEYQQLIEISYITFLLHIDSIFYLASLARNTLASRVRQEINLIEDMLVALDDLSQVGKAVRDSATLNNANTALLALDAAQSVSNRPETKRFTALMDQYAEKFRSGVISRSTGTLVRPREDARNILRINIQKLSSVHEKMIEGVTHLRDLLDNFNSLDIPSRVAANSISNIRSNIQQMIDEIGSKSDTELLARSRQNLLTTLSSKMAVEILSGFRDPSALKARSPVNPIPPTANHLGRVTGEGAPASVSSGSGPWELPMTDSLVLKVDGSSSYTIDIDTIIGAALNGRLSEPFSVEAGIRNLHVLVDKNVYSGTSIDHGPSSPYSYVQTNTDHPMGFKHLGSPVAFFGVDNSLNPTDGYPRSITECRHLQSFTITGYNPTDRRVTISGASLVEETTTAGFAARHIGCYIKEGDNRWEILDVENSTNAIVSIPDAGIVPSAGAGRELRGETSDAPGNKFFFGSSLIAPILGQKVVWGPAVKTVRFNLNLSSTVSDLIAAVENNQGNYDVFYTNDKGPALNQHVKMLPVAGSPTKVALVARSKNAPYIQIGDTFPRPKLTPGLMVTNQGSIHARLGFIGGESDTTNSLTPAELVNWINANTSGILAEEVLVELGEGSSLQTNVVDTQVTDPTVSDFSPQVRVGDQIQIRSGLYSTGVRQIENVSGPTLTLSGPVFFAAETGLSYRLFREQVRISSEKGDRGNSIEVVSGPSELEFPSGVYYGSISQFEAINKLGELFDFSSTEVDVQPEDVLRVVGVGSFRILSVEGTLLQLSAGLPSNTLGKSFEIKSASAEEYTKLQSDLATFTASASLLKKNRFDESIEAVDSALTAAILPGQNFASSRNKARQVLATLLSILTGQPRRAEEYTVDIPTSPMNLEDILNDYAVSPVPALSRLIDAFQERKYDRAVSLLKTGKITEFFETNEETGSFGGAVINASRSVDRDLPGSPTSAFAVDDNINLAVASGEVADADRDFGDTEGGGLNIEE